MAACEKCWRDANLRMLTLGGSVTDHYHALLKERKDNPCQPDPDRDARELHDEGYTEQLRKV